MKRSIRLSVALVLLLAVFLTAYAQLEYYKGDPLYRYIGFHGGNKIRTVFYNYGLVGDDGEISGEWPIGTGNEYIGDVTIAVGIEYIHPSGDTIHSVVTCKSPRGTDDINDGIHMGFEALPGFGQPPLQGSDESGQVAMSHIQDSWPAFWPDKMYTDPRDQLWEADDNDPGWAGKWNGFFGKDVQNADQESYFQMDDNMDTEFRIREDSLGNELTYYPTIADPSRGGMGIRVAARGFQWSHFLAEDVIIWHYEITNISDYDYNKVVFGMVVGTLSGGRGPSESEDDLASFDPDNDITYSYDNDDISTTPGWVPVSDNINIGYAGYAFLESPGNPFDGIDNDGDGRGPSPILEAEQLRQWALTGIEIDVGEEFVIIDYSTYERSVVEMPDEGFYVFESRDGTDTVFAATNYKEDGYNGLDDNFNGLIDERYGVAVHGKRLDHAGLRYIDYLTGNGLDDPMIDEARDDGIDNDGDWDPITDDLGFDGAPGTNDRGEGDGTYTLGEPHFDKTDIDESDQIGLTSFDYFDNQGTERLFLRADHSMWSRLRPGVIDSTIDVPMDGDFIYGSGYFPLRVGKTERFSLALFMGEDLQDITQNKIAVQTIYNNNYNFARPPEKPTVTAVAGDGYVTLYWDDVAESSFDPSMPEGYRYDFEGYKIYRATDFGFLENYTITDGRGRKVFHDPIIQFDLEDGVSGYFPGGQIGVSYYLGEDSGIQHVWSDSTVENGQTYYYAVSAYDFGHEALGFFPAETSKSINLKPSGELILDQNTVVVTPGAHADGYAPPVLGLALQTEGSSNGVVYVESVDPTVIPADLEFRVEFSEENENGEATRADMYEISTGTPITVLSNIDMDNRGENREVLRLFDDTFDYLYNDSQGDYDTRSFFQTIETNMFHGMRSFLLIPRYPGRFIHPASGWTLANVNVPEDSMISFSFNLINYPNVNFTGTEYYADYEVEFFDHVVDTSTYYDASRRGVVLEFPSRPIYYKVTNLKTGKSPIVLAAIDSVNDGRIHDKSEILLMEEYDNGVEIDTIPTWSITFHEYEDDGQVIEPSMGDKLKISMYKPFSAGDVYEFSPQEARIVREEVDMNRIKVYPNPYLGANSQEPVNPYLNSGRGERRITFNHLPDQCTIRIYNVRGELVQKLEHNNSIFDGTENWDLRSMEGLDVAYGIYVYHVESKYGDHVGKFALIK